jgi:hypothetical protein
MRAVVAIAAFYCGMPSKATACAPGPDGYGR